MSMHKVGQHGPYVKGGFVKNIFFGLSMDVKTT